ncbi:SH3 domain-containing protein [Anaerolineales bacterium HSG24]|nr:SH3 domain-containing protein [Anaerolineales bacterium HSG24]
MKGSRINNLVVVSFIMVITLIITACGSQPSQSGAKNPKVVVVTATATEVPNIVNGSATAEVTVSVEPIIEPTTEPTTEPIIEPITETQPDSVYELGTLLKGTGEGVFRVTASGSRKHIYDWDTFLAFGFKPEEIIEVDDAVLENYPLDGELTRLLYIERSRNHFDLGDELYQLVQSANKDLLFWVDNGMLIRAERWIHLVKRVDYNGMPITDLSVALANMLPLNEQLTVQNGAVLHDGEQAYYVDNYTLVPMMGSYNEATVIHAPNEILEMYLRKPTLQRANTQLVTVDAANLRRGPGTNFKVEGTVYKEDNITVVGRSEHGDWLQVEIGNTSGWLAKTLVQDNLALNLVQLVNTSEMIPDVPAAEPAALSESEESNEESDTEDEMLKPLYCSTVPLRGFGKVWGDNLTLQYEIGCTWEQERGTNAAIQTFQHGTMLWLERDRSYGSDPVYVFFNDGSYQRFGDLGAADPTKVEDTPTGFYDVGDRFSKIYWEGTGVKVKERLGYATSETVDSAGAFQNFSRGSMFWSEVSDEIYVILDHSYWEDDTNIRVRRWERYEDLF